MDEKQIAQVVQRVLQEVRGENSPAAVSSSPAPKTSLPCSGITLTGKEGLFQDVDSAVAAARQAYEAFIRIPLQERAGIVEEVRRAMYPHCRRLAEMAVEDTAIGNVEDKTAKNQLALDKSPGVEDVQSECHAGGYGVTMEQLVPFGVIGSITPTTNPTSTIINHMLIMPAAGNTIVFNFHPNAALCSTEAMHLMNQLYREAGAPANLAAAVEKPTLKDAIKVMEHPNIDLLVVTGGKAVVDRAMQSGKRVLAAGPGNPPVIVDETADIELAGSEIVAGSSFDNNVPCICEKEVFVVHSVADALITAMKKSGAYLLSSEQTKALQQLVVTPDNKLVTEFIGKDIRVILEKIGIVVDKSIKLAICETDFDHPFVQLELMMPILPIVRVKDYSEAAASALKAEHGFRHTALIHSRNIDRITKFARVMQVSLFAANGRCATTLGYNAEGCTALTICGLTGEGVTRPRTFVKRKRLVVNNALNIL